MQYPFESKTLRIPHDNEHCVNDCVEEKVIFDMAKVEYFSETTFNNKQLTRGTCIEFERYGMNITTPFNEFKQAMEQKGLLNVH